MSDTSAPEVAWAPLQERLAVVTGAAGGLGRATVERLLGVGAHVIASDLNPEALAAMAAEVQHPTLSTVVADVNTEAGMAALEAAVAEHSVPLGLWVNNAGIVRRGPAEDFTTADWDLVVNVNTRASLTGAQVAFRRFRAQGTSGSIVNLSSVTATAVMAGRALYGTAKAATEHLTKQLAVEWGQYGIRVNAVAPGFILTPISHLWNASEAEREEAAQEIAARRLGDPIDIANAILWLGSDNSAYVTGQTLLVDGGLTLV